MKKYLFVFTSIVFFSCTNINLFAHDSKLKKHYNERTPLNMVLDSINSHISDTTFFDLKRLVSVQADIMRIDQSIISVLQENAETLNLLQIKFEDAEKDRAKLKIALDESQYRMMLGLYIGAALIALLVLFVILFIIKLSQSKKAEKKLAELSLISNVYKKKSDETDTGIENQQETEDALKEALSKTNNLEQTLLAKESEINNLTRQNEGLDKLINEKSMSLQNIEADYQKRITELNEVIKEKEQHTKEDFKYDNSKLADELSIMTRNWEDEKLQVIALKEEIASYISEIKQLKEQSGKEIQNSQPIHDAILKEDMAVLQSQLIEVRQQLVQKTKEVENLSAPKENSIEKEETISKTAVKEDSEVLVKENEILKTEVDAYKKLLDEELEVRKEILSFIEELKTLK